MKFVNKYGGGGAVVKKEPIKIKEDLSKRESSTLDEFHKKTAGGDRGLRDIPKKKEETEEETVVKKESFNTAFGNARKAGLKVFEWNGKKYGTELAKKVVDKKTPSDERESKINYGQGRNPNYQEPKVKAKPSSTSTVKESAKAVTTAPVVKPIAAKDSIARMDTVVTKPVINDTVPARTVAVKAKSSNTSPDFSIVKDRKNIKGKSISFLLNGERYYGKDRQSINSFRKRVDTALREKSKQNYLK